MTGAAAGVRFHVGNAVVARVAAQCAHQVPGVLGLRADLAHALLGLAGSVLGPDLVQPATDGVTATVHGDRAEIALTVVTRIGVNCRDLARAVQQEVAAAVTAYTGLAVVVQVTIAEVRLD
ncbi:Asp23/Gls24 family envelope stress response protein [Pseudonocardia bannensis]|uniref:Asp23/Gls24 family envelope stress response protein n=1 Tax=Pseudonocardia bannensis TaxID=630973 RepID=A0A848DFX2_9PSEU|nr:Asp23/Gls24 family envelope stress response protein [Pseudonocardia bannensis]NMH91454.1 Asp23/Gls24 family envelope stress response protein [Pseudonocardia bannensis]